MNHSIRVIPKLDIKGPNLVKGIHLEGLRVLGKPETFARQYYQAGADELFFVDVVASLYERNSLDDIISRTAREIFIPLTVAGGIRSVDDIKRVLRAGADKVALNTAAIHNPDLIKEAAQIFGSSTISISIEALKQKDGCYLAYTDNGREFTGVEVVNWVKQVESLGAGEIIITSIDREGTGHGYDLTLTKLITDAVSIPVVASGGGNTLSTFSEAVLTAGASAIAMASALHYQAINDPSQADDFTTEGNTEFLKQHGQYSKIKPTNIQTIKAHLLDKGIECRV